MAEVTQLGGVSTSSQLQLKMALARYFRVYTWATLFTSIGGWLLDLTLVSK
jgi:hypothetical protein